MEQAHGSWTVGGRVLIAGGGIGGLALAIGLRARGVPVTVVERSPRPHSQGSGLVLAPNGVKALDWLGPDLGRDVRAAGAVSGASGTSGHRSAFLNRHGRALAELTFDGTEALWGAPIISLRHASLRRILRADAERQGATLVDGRRAEGFSVSADGVALQLDSGETLSGELLVGADGIRSTTRAALLDDGAPSYRGFSAVRGIGPRPSAYPDGFIAYGRGAILFVSAVDDEQAYWVASVCAPEGDWPQRTPASALSAVRARMSDFDPSIREIVEASDAGGCLVTDVYDRDRVRTWSGPRVALLGDAAHPMVFTMGQGANTALEDATVLADRLTHADSLASALASYEADRIERTATIAAQSRMMGAVGMTRNAALCWMRDRMMSWMPRLMDFDKQNAPVFGWEPPARRLT